MILVMDCDVTQGYILGPLLFLIYLNDFYCTSNMFTLLLHADDITIYIYGNDINKLLNTRNDELVIIANRLSLNLNKSSFIIFQCSKNLCYLTPPSIIKVFKLLFVETFEVLQLKILVILQEFVHSLIPAFLRLLLIALI